ncbi:ABC transporter ATP-binding protein [Bradyrhizobium genosp. A]|uniref:ABC transporter ATP-binding protein n=1 Tax=Bradyrhizobium genosp. A TaxID=83626 RepID=UPI003CFB2CA2
MIVITLGCAIAGIAGAYLPHLLRFLSPGELHLVRVAHMSDHDNRGRPGIAPWRHHWRGRPDRCSRISSGLCAVQDACVRCFACCFDDLAAWRHSRCRCGLEPQQEDPCKMRSSEIILTLREVTRRFGGLVAVNKLSMDVKEASIHGLIGPNGAGKSTAFDLISGLTTVSAGEICFRGEAITHMTPEARVASGICRTFQTPKLFDEMTVLDVVATGRHLHNSVGLWGSMFSIGRKRREEAKTVSAAREFLDIVGLLAKADAPVADLSYGDRRLVEIARALASPTFCCLTKSRRA